MTKRILAFILVWMLMDISADARKFVFIQISDPQLGFREEEGFAEGERLLEKTVDLINSTEPAFVIVTGDMTNSSSSKIQYEAYRTCMSRISGKIKVLHLPGNHDIKKTDEESLAAYREKYGNDRFCFRHGKTTVLGLNSPIIISGTPEQEEEQFRWLEKCLSKAVKSDHIFVFMHYPVVTKDLDEKETYSNFPVSKRRRYVELFKKYGVDVVFAGHLHQNFDCDMEGVRMITCGPSGLPLGKGYSGYNLIEVDGKNYVCTYLPVE